MEQECSVARCGRSVKARGWCGMHYARWRTSGSLELAPAVGSTPREPAGCVREGCDRRRAARKMCRLHYSQWRAGVVEAAQCSATGCTSKARADGRCGRHRSVRQMVELTGEKACSDCRQVFPADHFERDYRYPDRGVAKCRTCMARGRSDASLRRRYGIGRAEFDSMLSAQGGGCAVCGSADRLCVDHDHQTGAVRKILCDRCNRAIGVVDDDAGLLEKLAQYLRLEMETP